MLEIKKTGIQDIQLIQQLAHAIWPDAYGEILSVEQMNYMLNLFYSKEALTNQVENLHHQFLIVSENHKVVGFASYSPKQANVNTAFHLHKLYVLPDQQGKGTGKFLLEYIIKEIKSAGANFLELNVNRDNKALHFYKKIGFVISKKEDNDIGSGYFMNDFVMSLKL